MKYKKIVLDCSVLWEEHEWLKEELQEAKAQVNKDDAIQFWKD